MHRGEEYGGHERHEHPEAMSKLSPEDAVEIVLLKLVLGYCKDFDRRLVRIEERVKHMDALIAQLNAQLATLNTNVDTLIARPAQDNPAQVAALTQFSADLGALNDKVAGALA